MLPNIDKLILCSLFNGALISTHSLHAVVFSNATEITVRDSGDNSVHTVSAGASSAITNVEGDLNLESFVVGSTTLQVNNYASGIGSNTTLTTAILTDVFQPGNFLNTGDNIEFYTGTTNNAPPQPR